MRMYRDGDSAKNQLKLGGGMQTIYRDDYRKQKLMFNHRDPMPERCRVAMVKNLVSCHHPFIVAYHHMV